MHSYHKILFTLTAVILTSCMPSQQKYVPQNLQITQDVKNKNALCHNKLAIIDINFLNSRANHCQIVSTNAITITIDPEDKPINHSPWYAFRITPKHPGTLSVNLQYSHSKHRYPPKISYDGIKWKLLNSSKIHEISENKIRMRIMLKKRPIYIAAQEIFSVQAHNTWLEKTAKLSFVTKTVIGNSFEGRPIYKIETKTNPEANHSKVNYSEAKKPYIVIVGRQHPPEVTGALALVPFVETILGNSKLAKNFRNKFNIIIIPLINPDGVVHGNWRHNMNGIDLNRDWGPFTQPETKTVQKEFRRFKTGDDKIILFIDFHSTTRNLLYMQADDKLTNPPYFAKDWVNAVTKRLDKNIYEFTREENKKTSGRPTSKHYMYTTYGIPAITYEVGDNSDRQSIKKAADIFAQEMMKILLPKDL